MTLTIGIRELRFEVTFIYIYLLTKKFKYLQYMYITLHIKVVK